MKRFRVRPVRDNLGNRVWQVGPDTGRLAPLSPVFTRSDCGETIDALAERGRRKAVEIGTGGRGIMHFRKHKKPEYPEH